jgi:hypothetical protein
MTINGRKNAFLDGWGLFTTHGWQTVFPSPKSKPNPEFQTRELTAAGDYGHQASPARRRRARHRHPVLPGGGPGAAVLLRAAEPVRGGDAAAQRDLRRRAQGDTTAADHVRPRRSTARPVATPPSPPFGEFVLSSPSLALPAHSPLLFGYRKKKKSVSMAFSAVWVDIWIRF